MPTGKVPINCQWIYKIKTYSDRSIKQYKARLVARDFTQEYGVDYEETFASVTMMTSIRVLITLVAARGWLLYQLNVKS